MSALKEHITAPLMNIVKILSEDFGVGHYQVPDYVMEREKKILNIAVNLVFPVMMENHTRCIPREPDVIILTDFV